jgi:hypothetical protein
LVPAPRLRDHHPPHRCWPVRLLGQFLPQGNALSELRIPFSSANCPRRLRAGLARAFFYDALSRSKAISGLPHRALVTMMEDRRQR